MPDDLAGAGTAVVDAGAGGATEGAAPATEIETTEGTPEGGEGGTGIPAGTEGETTEVPAEGEPGDETPGEGEGEPGEGEEFDGRKLDAKTRSALAKLKKVDPLVAKELASTYHRAQRIVKDVGATNLSDAVTKISAMAATLESVGGAEGLVELNEEVGDYRNEIKQFADGDPELPTQLYESNPKGLATATTTSLEILAAKDAELFKESIRSGLVTRLEQAGMFNSIAQLGQLIMDGKGQEAYDLTSKIGNWLQNEKGLQKKAIDARAERNPEREALERERGELAQQKTQMYENQIGVDVNRMNNRSMARIVEPFFKEIKLMDPLGRRKFVQAVQTDVWEAMRNDKTFQMQARAIKARNDVAATAEFVSAKFAELLPAHFRANRNAMYPSYKVAPMKKKVVPTNGAGTAPKAPAAGGAAPGAGTPIKLAAGQRPKHTDVDWAKTPDLDWIRGKAVLKNGKAVTFDKNAPPNHL